MNIYGYRLYSANRQSARFVGVDPQIDPKRQDIVQASGLAGDGYENCVMREYRMAAVRRSILNLCFLHVSSNIRGIQSADGRLSTRLIGESICM